MKKYICHSCGYPYLDEPTWDIDGFSSSFNICPCCGIEYGIEDLTEIGVVNYRNDWIQRGYDWFDNTKKPEEWDYNKQLLNVTNSMVLNYKLPRWWEEILDIEQFDKNRNELIFYIVPDGPTNQIKIHIESCSFLKEESFNEKVVINRNRNGKYFKTNDFIFAQNQCNSNVCKSCLRSANF